MFTSIVSHRIWFDLYLKVENILPPDPLTPSPGGGGGGIGKLYEPKSAEIEKGGKFTSTRTSDPGGGGEDAKCMNPNLHTFK